MKKYLYLGLIVALFSSVICTALRLNGYLGPVVVVHDSPLDPATGEGKSEVWGYWHGLRINGVETWKLYTKDSVVASMKSLTYEYLEIIKKNSR